jgi:ABC-2 type transport system permease protein
MRLLLDLRAFVAAARKEWRLLRRYPTEFIGIVIWPLVLPGVYVLQAQGFSGGDPQALNAFAQRTGTLQVAGFLYLGGAVFNWASIVLWGPGMALRHEQLRGTLEELFLTPSRRFVILFGPAPAYVLEVLWMFAVIFVALRFGFRVPIGLGEGLRALAVIAIATPVLFAIGGLFAASVVRLGEVSATVQAVRGVIQLLCGVTFPIVVLPQVARSAALALPPTHVIASIRAVVLTGSDLGRILPDIVFLLASGLVIGVCAVVVFGRLERSAKRLGTLGQF